MSKKDKKNVEVPEEGTTQQTEEKPNGNTAETAPDPIAELTEAVEKEKDRYLRLFAEFENYKKRTARERIELFKTAGESIITALLPILDDFDRALKEFSDAKDDVHVQGMMLINNKLNETLKQKGLERIEVKPGDTFDADAHEAVTQIPAPSRKMKGKVIDVVEQGYKLGDKTIRYPKAVVGQ
ncbi:MAG: nucleotide exchange factor GrpE [Marinirhabdus sp.]